MSEHQLSLCGNGPIQLCHTVREGHIFIKNQKTVLKPETFLFYFLSESIAATFHILPLHCVSSLGTHCSFHSFCVSESSSVCVKSTVCDLALHLRRTTREFHESRYFVRIRGTQYLRRHNTLNLFFFFFKYSRTFYVLLQEHFNRHTLWNISFSMTVAVFTCRYGHSLLS